MAPLEEEALPEKDVYSLQNEINSISKFLKVSPVRQEKINIEELSSLNKRERLMRLFLEYFLPRNVFPDIFEEDLAYLTAYNILNVTEKELLTEEWYRKRRLSPSRTDKPLMQFEDGTMYRSIHDLLEADSFTYGEFLFKRRNPNTKYGPY